jgi:hypothetical protein
VGGFSRAHDISLNNYNFNTLIGSHLKRLGTRNDVIVQKEYTVTNKGIIIELTLRTIEFTLNYEKESQKWKSSYSVI